jgi:hypothetical protein
MSGTTSSANSIVFPANSIPVRFLPIRQVRETIHINNAGSDGAGTFILFMNGLIFQYQSPYIFLDMYG